MCRFHRTRLDRIVARLAELLLGGAGRLGLRELLVGLEELLDVAVIGVEQGAGIRLCRVQEPLVLRANPAWLS